MLNTTFAYVYDKHICNETPPFFLFQMYKNSYKQNGFEREGEGEGEVVGQVGYLHYSLNINGGGKKTSRLLLNSFVI